MVQTFFKRSCTIDRLRQGPLAGHIDLLAAGWQPAAILGPTAGFSFGGRAFQPLA
jgi:hypothetical protein